MAMLTQDPGGARFVGSPDSDRDVDDAARLASACGGYRRDDEDEDPVGGATNCFGCRYRRWVPDGFTCLKDRLPEEMPPAS